MAVIVVVLCAALVGAVVVALLSLRLPNFDPAAPRASAKTITKEVADHAGARTLLRSRLDAETLTGLALTIGLAIVLLGVVAAGALLVMVQHNAGLARYDLSAARWGASHATSGSTRFLKDVSFLGGTEAMILFTVIAAVVEYLRTRKWAVVSFLSVVIIGEVILQNVTKVIVNRDRPNIHRLTGFSSSSFPSGHAMTAAAVFAAIALLVGRGRSPRTKAVLAGAAAGIAVAVATTRVFLGVHWLTDVIAGLAMGWAWFAICSIAFGGRVLSFGQPVVIAEAESVRTSV
ncbi:MAG TPA: phosphatase PAP2 family protein [Acidimicrobiia bacterium]|nr:phosphatase PAP2 family protein [Acidimicrobiia bacterium]